MQGAFVCHGVFRSGAQAARRTGNVPTYAHDYKKAKHDSEHSAHRHRNRGQRVHRSGLQLPGDGSQVGSGVGRTRCLHPQGRRQRRTPLRVGHVPVPLGRPAHGPRRGLRHGRCRLPLLAPVRLRRHAPDRLGLLRPAGRERRHQAQRPPRRVDLRQHRHPGRQLQALRDLRRLGPPPAHLGPGVLPLDPVAVHPLLRKGPGLPQEPPGELVPEGPDRAGQRAGRQRRLRALRHRRSPRSR